MTAGPGSPGREAQEMAGVACGCITCGDVADAMKVVRIDEGRVLALCEDGAGQRHTVEIALVVPVAVGDELLVHAGTAIAGATPGTPGREAEEVPA